MMTTKGDDDYLQEVQGAPGRPWGRSPGRVGKAGSERPQDSSGAPRMPEELTKRVSEGKGAIEVRNLIGF
eukprot:9410968-Karenia_brevis.AAC.1